MSKGIKVVGSCENHHSQLVTWTSCGKIVILALLIFISFKVVLVKFSKKYISFLLFYQAYTYIIIKNLHIYFSALCNFFFSFPSLLYFSTHFSPKRQSYHNLHCQLIQPKDSRTQSH